MLLSLFLTASVLLHITTAPLHSSARPLFSTHRSHHADTASHSRVITSVKGTVQFIFAVPPPAPSHSPEAPVRRMPLRPTLFVNTPAEQERDEQSLIQAINAARAEQGLEPLSADPLLTETARAHSREMCDQGYFEHHSPTPGLVTPIDRFLRMVQDSGESQPASALVGENIFYCSATSRTYNMAYAHQSLMASPGHRANILDMRFTKVGVGLYRDRQGRFWVTEMFLRDM